MSTRDRLARLTADLKIPAETASPEARDATGVETRFPPTDSAARTEESDLAGPLNGPADRSGSPPEGGAAAAMLETRFPAVMPRPPGRRTGPGDMLAFRGKLLEVESESSHLRDRLQEFEGSLPTRKIDAKLVVPSRWANRHESSFKTPEFTRFKADIEHAGGNVQPILVRALSGKAGKYELVFGHRRHRACLELDLPVFAAIAIEPMADADLFAAMDRENRERADLSAWEQGTMYLRALEESMFPSQRKLAEALGVSHTWVRKAITVAELPEYILQCFRSPLEVDFRHAEEINATLLVDRKGVQRRAERLRQSERMTASSVVAALVGKQRGGNDTPRDLKAKDTVLGRLTWDSRGQATIKLRPGVLHADNVETVVKAIEASIAAAH